MEHHNETEEYDYRSIEPECEGDIESAHPTHHHHHGKLKSNKKKLKNLTVACGCCFLMTLVVYLILLFAIVPSVAQGVLDSSTLVLVKMHMKEAENDSIVLNATNQLHDVGPMSATLQSSIAEVHYGGDLLATMTMPELDIVGGEVLEFNMETKLKIENKTAFTLATARILQGLGGRWYIRGKAHLKLSMFGFGRVMALDLNQAMDIPPTLLEDVKGYGGDVVEGSGEENSLNLTARTSFFSSSVLEMHSLGEFVFDLYIPTDPNTGEVVVDPNFNIGETVNVRVGEVMVDNFDVRQGLNDFPSSGRVLKTVDNEKVLSRFMSSYLEGIDQVAILKGPTKSPAIYLDNVVEQKLVFSGAPDYKPVEVSLLDKQTSFVGFAPKLPDGSKPQYRGPNIIVHNTLNATVIQRDVQSSIFLEEPLGYKLHHPVLGRHTCPKSDKLALLQTAPGMDKNDPEADPIVLFKPKEKRTVFMPGGPMPNQSKQKACKVLGQDLADGADCCFVSLNVAAACRAKKRGHKSFDTRLSTEFTMQIGDFKIMLSVGQDSIATAFTEEVTAGFVEDAFMNCGHFTILE